MILPGINGDNVYRMIEPLRILIADDQCRTRLGLKALLYTKFRSLEVQEVRNGQEAVDCAKNWRPQIVLMDARMPEQDGIEATRVIKSKSPHTIIIVLSMYPEYQEQAYAAGADAFISKGEPPERLLTAIDGAARAAMEWGGK